MSNLMMLDFENDAAIQSKNNLEIKFSDVDSTELRDMSEVRALIAVGNIVYGFIRKLDENKFYVHCVDKNDYQYILSTTSIRTDRVPKPKTFNKLSQIFSAAEKIGLNSMNLCVNKSRQHSIVDGYLVTQIN